MGPGPGAGPGDVAITFWECSSGGTWNLGAGRVKLLKIRRNRPKQDSVAPFQNRIGMIVSFKKVAGSDHKYQIPIKWRRSAATAHQTPLLMMV